MAPVSQAANGICYSVMGEITTAVADLERMVNAVPRTIAAALNRKAYYFVPLTLNMGDDTMIADRYDVQLSDSAVCHRNQTLGDSQCVFISTRLMEDSFAIAFEFFINVGHNFVERVGVSQEFADLVWKQVDEKARGETVEQHPDTSQMLLDRGSRPLTLQLLDVGRDVHRLDAPEFANPPPFAPAQEGRRRRPRIRRPRVLVADVDGEEFEEAPRGFFPGPGNERRN